MNLTTTEALVCAAALRAVAAVKHPDWTAERLQTAQHLAAQIENAAEHE